MRSLRRAMPTTPCRPTRLSLLAILCSFSMKGVVGVAMTWPFAITAEPGKLHAVCEPRPGETLGHIEKALDVPDGSIARACRLARTLGFAIDAGLVPLVPELPATQVDG